MRKNNFFSSAKLKARLSCWFNGWLGITMIIM